MRPIIKTPTIPLVEAQLRVERFRSQFAASVPEGNIPRAVLIPIDDLLAIIEKFSFVDKDGSVKNELKGVRAYFAIKATDQALPDDVTALIVPVDHQGNDIISEKGIQGEDVSSDIYDFTKPCPSECDPESPLYIP